jgi:hypothetical protein
VASDEKFAPNKKTLTYSNIGAYLKRGITLVGGAMKVLHKGCMKQYCVGIFLPGCTCWKCRGVITIYIYIYNTGMTL